MTLQSCFPESGVEPSIQPCLKAVEHDADDLASREQALAEMRADESSPAGHKHAPAHAIAPRLCSSAASSIAGSAYGSSAAWAWARKRSASAPS